MAAGYFVAGKTNDFATFELSIRKLPQNRNFLVAAGLEQIVEYLLNLHFRQEEIDYLRSLAQFKNAPPEFFDYLSKLRFTGNLFAVPEGTPVFAGEPILIVRAPIAEAQIIETYLLSSLTFQTMVASKAARCAIAAEGHPIVEFGSRRAHSPGAGILAGRAAYIGGCAGTSNAEAGLRFGIPVFGTAAHSWTMAFPSEEKSFRALQRFLADSTVYLIDTYDTVEGARLVTRLGQPVWGVRLDSGDIDSLSREVRRILDDAGLHSAKIFATNELDEFRIAKLVRAGAPVDAFGVGTQLATSADAPTLSGVYKLVELESNGAVHYTAKFSDEKSTLPATKQIYRYSTYDMVALASECNSDYRGEPLLRPIVVNGELVEPLPSIEKVRSHSASCVSELPPELWSLEETATYRIEISPRLLGLAESIRATHLLV